MPVITHSWFNLNIVLSSALVVVLKHKSLLNHMKHPVRVLNLRHPFPAFTAGLIDGKPLSPKSLDIILDLLAMILSGLISNNILCFALHHRTFFFCFASHLSRINIISVFISLLKFSRKTTLPQLSLRMSLDKN